MPIISVIVPVYKVEKYIYRCVDSILAQTFTDFELILVDDGSPDNCGAICDEYAVKDSRIRVIHKKNEGVSVARNTALDIACGEYVAFCDSDDSWEASLLQTVMDAADGKKADCVLFGYNTYSDDGWLRLKTFEPGCYDISNEQDSLNYLLRVLFGRKHGWEMCFHVFDRKVIEEFHIRCCTACNNFAEDLGFVCRYMLHSKRLVCIPDVLYNYYLREDSMMRTSKTLVRLNDLSEVAWDVWQDFDKTIKDSEVRRQFPHLYFMMMNNQLQKMYKVPDFMRIPEEISKLRRLKWWKKNIRELLFCYPELKKHYGTHRANRTMLFITYLLHGKWKLYGLESGLYYKLYNRTKR